MILIIFFFFNHDVYCLDEMNGLNHEFGVHQYKEKKMSVAEFKPTTYYGKILLTPYIYIGVDFRFATN